MTPNEMYAASSATKFDNKCFYTRRNFTCSHTAWLQKPRITHRCGQSVTNKRRCSNMADRPLEASVNEVCKDCKLQGRGASNALLMTGSAGASKSTSGPVAAVVGPSIEKAKAEKQRDNNQKVVEEIFLFEDSKLDKNDRTSSKAKDISEQNGLDAAAPMTTTASSITALTISAPSTEIPEEKSSAPKRKTLAEEGWVKIKKERDWDMITPEDAKEADVDENPDTKMADQVKGGRVEVSEATGEEDASKDEEHPEWNIVAVEEGKYLQGVDGWNLKKDEKNKCRVN